MTANHLILGDRDWTQRPGVTVSASSAAAGMPAANVLDFRPGVRWRASTASAETLTVDFGEDVDVDTIALVGHNGSTSATVLPEIAADGDAAFAAPVYAGSALDLWPPVYGFGEQFGYSFKGYADPDDLGVYVSLRAIRLGAQYRGRYLRLTFTDAASPISAIELGVVMAGVGTSFARNYAFGYEIDQIDPSEQRRTDGGGVIVTARAIYPQLRLRFPALSKSEALTIVQTLKRRVGRQKPVLVMLDPTASPSTLFRLSFYGLFSRYTPTRYTAFDLAECEFTLDGLI